MSAPRGRCRRPRRRARYREPRRLYCRARFRSRTSPMRRIGLMMASAPNSATPPSTATTNKPMPRSIRPTCSRSALACAFALLGRADQFAGRLLDQNIHRVAKFGGALDHCDGVAVILRRGGELGADADIVLGQRAELLNLRFVGRVVAQRDRGLDMLARPPRRRRAAARARGRPRLARWQDASRAIQAAYCPGLSRRAAPPPPSAACFRRVGAGCAAERSPICCSASIPATRSTPSAAQIASFVRMERSKPGIVGSTCERTA